MTPDTRSDAELIRASRTSDEAFRELYDRYSEQVYRYHRGRTSDHAAAYDLTAETFAQAWLGRRRFEDRAGGSAGPWIFGIARNLVLASVRRRRLEQAASTRLGLLDALDRGEPAAPDETWLLGLDEALAEIPNGQRAAVELRVVHDLTYDEVGKALGTTPRAARVRVHRGLAALRSYLTNEKEATE